MKKGGREGVRGRGMEGMSEEGRGGKECTSESCYLSYQVLLYLLILGAIFYQDFHVTSVRRTTVKCLGKHMTVHCDNHMTFTMARLTSEA